MKDALKKIFILGVGVERITRKQVEQALKTFEKGKLISRLDSKELAKKFLNEAKKAERKIKSEGNKELKDIKKNAKKFMYKSGKKAYNTLRQASKRVARAALRV